MYILLVFFQEGDPLENWHIPEKWWLEAEISFWNGPFSRDTCQFSAGGNQFNLFQGSQ